MKPRLGLIDDQVLIRKSIVGLLDAMDEYNIIFDVTTFVELEKKLNDNEVIDVLLMDIKMPDKSGFDIALWMKDKFPLIAVLALSSETDGYSISKVIKNGAKGFVDKGAEPEELALAIETVMNGDAFLSQKDLNKFSSAIQNDLNELMNVNVTFIDRELEFIKLCCTSLSYPEIAAKMFLSDNSVGSYRISVFTKLRINTRQELAVYAAKNNLT